MGKDAALAEHGLESRNTGSGEARFAPVPGKTGSGEARFAQVPRKAVFWVWFLFRRGKRLYRRNVEPIPWVWLRFASERGGRGACRTWT